MVKKVKIFMIDSMEFNQH